MRSILVALLLSVTLCGASPAPQRDEVDMCTIVAVETIDTVDSARAQPGDFFRFKTINSVTAGNRIVIPAHALGWGIVVIASPAGRSGRAGTLVLEPRYIVGSGGRKLGVVLDHKPSDLAQSGSSNSLPGYLGAIPVPGFGAAIGAFNYFHRGKNITVPKGTLFAIFPSDDPKTARCQNL